MKELFTFILLVMFWFIFIFLINISIANADAPDWVLGKGHKSFPDSKYLVGVGLSDKSPITASESARAELIKSIRVKVNSVALDYNSRDKSVSESSIMSETDFLLEGSQVKDGWYDSRNNLYYSFVVIERKLVLETLKAIIDNILQSVALMLRQGDAFYVNGDIIKALVYYYDGYKESEKLLPCIQTYNSVIMVNEYKNEYGILFREKILNIVDNIYLEKVNKTLTVSNIHLNVRAMYNGRGIKNFPIKFSSGYNRYSERILCNRVGECVVNPRITKVAHVDDADISIKAVVDLQTFERHFNHSLKKNLFGRLELLSVSFNARKRINKSVASQPIQPKRTFQQPVKFRTFYKNDIGLGPLRRPFFIDRWKARQRGYHGNVNIRIGW